MYVHVCVYYVYVNVVFPSIEKLLQRLLDNDEKVRLTTVKIISEIAIEDLSSVPSKVSNHTPQWGFVGVVIGYYCVCLLNRLYVHCKNE